MISDEAAQAFLVGAGSALVGALVGSVVPSWWQSRRSTVAALRLLISELESNKAMLDGFVASATSLVQGGYQEPLNPISFMLELRSMALDSAAAGTSSFAPETRGYVLRTYQLIERIERAVDRLHGLHSVYSQKVGAPASSRAGGHTLLRPANEVRAAMALAESQVLIDCEAAAEAAGRALDALRRELTEFSEGRLW